MSEPNQSFEFERTDGFAISEVEARATFISRTYMHLLAALAAFIALEAALISAGIGDRALEMLIGAGRGGILVYMGVVIGGTMLAQMMAASSRSLGPQYAGLALYILVETVLFLPILAFIQAKMPDGLQIIYAAGGCTAVLFGMLTGVVFYTRKDFSFLGSFLYFAMLAALGLIVAGLIFGFTLGIVFTYAMIAIACLWILYDTSNILYHYDESQYVAASLALFASVMLLFWYILRLFMDRR